MAALSTKLGPKLKGESDNKSDIPLKIWPVTGRRDSCDHPWVLWIPLNIALRGWVAKIEELPGSFRDLKFWTLEREPKLGIDRQEQFTMAIFCKSHHRTDVSGNCKGIGSWIRDKISNPWCTPSMCSWIMNYWPDWSHVLRMWLTYNHEIVRWIRLAHWFCFWVL